MALFRPIVLLFFPCLAWAQVESLTDTIYFNNKWEQCAKKKHTFYRTCSMQDSLLTITDYYKNGVMQFKGTWFISDSSQLVLRFQGNGATHGSIGTFWYYYANGKPSSKIDYLPLGQPCNAYADYETERTNYAKNGIRVANWHEVKGKEEGTVYIYDPDNGELSSTQEMKDGLLHGRKVLYYTDGTIYSTTEYQNGKKHGFHTEYYSYPFRMKYRAEYENGKMQWREEY
jgi:antitoxin component YwqK of YwqJK toxin-antitoxin module